jgi:hypothetical protein
MANANGGIYQNVISVPAGKQLAYGVFKKVDTDFVCLRHMNDAFSAGHQAHFNLVTGAFVVNNNFGTASDGAVGFKALANGWWLVWIAVTLPAGNRIIEFYPLVTGGVQQVALGRSLDVTGFQLESGTVPTFPKITEGTMVSRSLQSILMSISPVSIPVGGLANAFVQFLDIANAPWDNHEGLNWFISDATKAEFNQAPPTGVNDIGTATLQLRALANGTTNITASTYKDLVTQTDLVTSNVSVLTVGGTVTARKIEILAEQGWYGVAGFEIAVYAKHISEKFPTTKLFEVEGQRFEQTPAAGNLSRMVVTPPSGVSLSLGQPVEAALRNPNYNGISVAGPGIFQVTVI